HLVQVREVGVVVIESGAALLENLHDLQGGGFAQVVDVLLVSHAKNQELGALETLVVLAQSRDNGIHDVERHEAEGLGGGGIDHFPDVHAHAQAEHLELVDEGDVDAAKDIFQEFGHFRGARRAHRDDSGDHLRVQGLGRAAVGRVHEADVVAAKGNAKLFVHLSDQHRAARIAKVVGGVVQASGRA